MSPTLSVKRVEIRGPKIPSAASCAVGATQASSPKSCWSRPRASSSAPSRTWRKRSRAEPAGASGRPSAPRRHERHELRAALVDVDAARGVGRQLAVVGEQQHERPGHSRQRVDQLLLDRLQQLERDSLRAGVVRPELVADGVEVVEIEQRQRRRSRARELRGKRRARPRRLDPVQPAASRPSTG